MLQTQQILKERYRLQQQLGNNAGRQTWLAEDFTASEPSLVIVKLLAFSPQMQWDEFKLFEREAQVLQSLNHPQLPRYRDSFSIDADLGEGLCWFGLVQDYIQGTSLQEAIDEGHRFSEQQVRSIAVQVLEILRDLHGWNPPILHRDIKPSNLILGTSGVYLIDFGAVCDATTVEGATFTVVGTAGYAPLEQFWGRAVPASDLYGLGATLIHLLTGIPPSELPQQNLRVKFRDRVNLQPSFLRWIETLTEPDLDRRFSSASQALEALQQGSALPKLSQPPGSKIRMKRSPKRLFIKIPPRSQSLIEQLSLSLQLWFQFLVSLTSRFFFFLPILIGIVLTLIVIVGVNAGQFTPYAWIVPLVLVPSLWWSWKRSKSEISGAIAEFKKIVEQKIGHRSLIFYDGNVYCSGDNRLTFLIAYPLWGFNIGNWKQHLVSDIKTLEAIPWEGVIIELEGEKYALDIELEGKRYVLGQHLSEMECEWMVQEIKDWIAENQSKTNNDGKEWD